MEQAPCILVSQARSRSSMLMNMLILGGVPCEYNTDTPLEKTKKEEYRNPHGFFETRVHTWTKCSKVLGPGIINQIPKDIKIIYLVRDFEQVCKSHIRRIPNWKGREIVANNRNIIEKWLTTRNYITIQSEDLIADPMKECGRIKEFIPEVNFNVDEAIKAINRTLIVVR